QRDQVERAGRERRVQRVPADPLDGDASPFSRPPCPVEGDVGDVDRCDPPTLLREPDGVRALTAADVERTAGHDARDLRDEASVRPAAPHALVAFAVPRVPLGSIVHAAILMSSAGPINPPRAAVAMVVASDRDHRDVTWRWIPRRRRLRCGPSTTASTS